MAIAALGPLAAQLLGGDGLVTDLLGAVGGAVGLPGLGGRRGAVIGGTVTNRFRGYLQIRTAGGKIITIKTAKRRRYAPRRARGGTTALMREMMPLLLMTKILK